MTQPTLNQHALTEQWSVNQPIILASASPRRQEILQGLGLTFKIQPAHIDEGPLQQAYSDPSTLVTTLAEAKAAAIAKNSPESVVIGSDTVVSFNGQILGKPRHNEDAKATLSSLQGNIHQVISGIAVVSGGSVVSEATTTSVTVSPLTDTEIDAYLRTGEPFDKAGAYAVQGLFAPYIDRIDGCYFNVVGLSPSSLKRLFKRLAL